MSEFKTIPTIALGLSKTFCIDRQDANTETLTLHSPALFVMTDFSRPNPNILDDDSTIDEALHVMQKSHVKSKLVVDKKMNILGIINMADLLSRKVLKTANERGVTRGDMTVKEVMVPVSELHGVSYEKIAKSSIGDALATMRQLGELHLLVFDIEQNLRGVISAIDISHGLNIAMDVGPIAHNFKDVFNVIHNHRELS
ncbi:CBS domain-containing protein [Aliiglaciecola sp. LCG003]|uniref:CBS domain-containing protein n=1 Tax=Aliiglaciecola sp. LCG003 TaxID=3053655 RepID=UPI0025726CF7|nr:CBS domain-containing protein [Aliiglaciecola sp. LCG003]WJG08765.1 CBS domain-containing protein [Aliiglaciecola sp. LCG003]